MSHIFKKKCIKPTFIKEEDHFKNEEMFNSSSAMGWALPETRLLQFDWLSAAQVWKTRV